MQFPIAGAVLSLGLMASTAFADGYECQITPKGRDNTLIASQLTIDISSERSDQMAVSDNLIHGVYGKPLQGWVVLNGANRAIFTWRLPVALRNDAFETMDLTLEVNKASGQAHIRGSFGWLRNTFTGTGACRPVSSATPVQDTAHFRDHNNKTAACACLTDGVDRTFYEQ